MFIKIRLISGMCFGLEFLWDHNAMVIDLGIVRCYVIKDVNKKNDD